MSTIPESRATPSLAGFDFQTLWNRYTMALDDVAARMTRITTALSDAGVPYALVGGQAVALWVATCDPSAIRTTKDVDLLLDRSDLGRGRQAARGAGMDYFEIMGVGMFLEHRDPNPRHAVHIVWAGEMLMPDRPLPSPHIDERETLPPGLQVVSLAGLVRMKLMANRDQDRVHLRDMIGVGLFGDEMLSDLPDVLAERLTALLNDPGR